CGPTGRAWLSEQILPGDERLAVERHLREFDRLTDDLKVIERDLAQSALAEDRATRLMTIPGINMVVALALIAAIGDITRFAKPEQLVGYLGLNPSVRQSRPMLTPSSTASSTTPIPSISPATVCDEPDQNQLSGIDHRHT